MPLTRYALERVLLSALDGTPTASSALQGNRDRQRTAIIEEGYEEAKAIRIAIAKAKEWAERRGLL